MRKFEYEELREKLWKIIRTKIPFWVSLISINIFIHTFDNDGMSAKFIARKYWVIGFLTVLIFCHGFGLLVRTITYIWPQLIFRE